MLKYMAEGLKAKTGVGTLKEEDKKWLDYNYPPLLRMFHYSTEELSPPTKSLAKKMHIAALIIVVIQPLTRK